VPRSSCFELYGFDIILDHKSVVCRGGAHVGWLAWVRANNMCWLAPCVGIGQLPTVADGGEPEPSVEPSHAHAVHAVPRHGAWQIVASIGGVGIMCTQMHICTTHPRCAWHVLVRILGWQLTLPL